MARTGGIGARLQWGRARAGAELVLDVPERRAGEAASMGPRPRGRGISLLVTSCQTGTQHLLCERPLFPDQRCLHFRFVHHSLTLLLTGFNGVRAGPGFEAPPCSSRIQLSKNMERTWKNLRPH